MRTKLHDERPLEAAISADPELRSSTSDDGEPVNESPNHHHRDRRWCRRYPANRVRIAVERRTGIEPLTGATTLEIAGQWIGYAVNSLMIIFLAEAVTWRPKLPEP